MCSLAYIIVYRSKAARAAIAFPPPNWMLRTLGWNGIFILNILIILAFLVNGAALYRLLS